MTAAPTPVLLGEGQPHAGVGVITVESSTGRIDRTLVRGPGLTGLSRTSKSLFVSPVDPDPNGGFPHGNRVGVGMCHWVWAPSVRKDLADLKKNDTFAAAGLEDQIDESEQGGLDSSTRFSSGTDYRCPLPFAPKGEPDPPWLGELKSPSLSKRGAISGHRRLYFGEPVNHADHVAGINLRLSKMSKLTEAANRRRQHTDIVQSMRHLKKFFRAQGYVWAPFAQV